jgi:hypothetical protein
MRNRKEKEIEAKLRKASAAFSVPDVKEAAKAQYLAQKDRKPEEKAQPRKRTVWPYPVFGSLAAVGACALVLFATPVRNLIFPASAGTDVIPTSYQTYEITSKQKQIASDAMVGASYLTKDSSSSLLKAAAKYRTSYNAVSSGDSNRDSYLSQLNAYMPPLEVALSMYDASITKEAAPSSSYDYNLSTSVPLLDGKNITSVASIKEESGSGEDTYALSGVLTASSQSMDFTLKRFQQDSAYFTESTIESATGEKLKLTEMKDSLRDDAKKIQVTYTAADQTVSAFDLCLGTKDNLPTVEVRMQFNDHPLDFVITKNSSKGCFIAASSHHEEDMDEFFIYPHDDSTGGSYYDYQGQEGEDGQAEWDYQDRRSKRPDGEDPEMPPHNP